MITVIDYGMGNIRSVVKALELYTPEVRVSNDPSAIATSRALVMPGDGAFGMAMDHLNSSGWTGPLKDFIHAGGFFLGICLGFQLLFTGSDEFGHHEGLGIIPGRVVRFPQGNLKVPHMGWNDVTFMRGSAYLDGIDQKSYFYFIHSFYPEQVDRDWILGQVSYGIEFPCIVGRNNLIATQFHPEKSHNAGLRIVRNFISRVYS